jgi:excisionase family DNA binding protein
LEDDDMELTVKQYAKLEQVTPRTVYHWIEKGVIQPRLTPGGKFRIRVSQSVLIVDMKTDENR